MKVSVRQENLAKALNVVKRAVESRPALPVLANVFLSAEGSRLTLAATNLQMSVSVWIGAQVHQPGSITLPAKTLLDLVNYLSNERVDMNLDPQNHVVNVRCGATNSNIKGIDADEFPPVTHNESTDFVLPAKELREMIRQTAFASAKEDTRPILTGVYLEVDKQLLTLAAADGFRLSVRSGRLDEAYPNNKTAVVVPARALRELESVLGDTDDLVEVALPSQRDIVTFRFGQTELSSQLIEGRFPDFRAIIPRAYITSTVMYTEDLLRACRRAEIFARDNAYSGRLTVKPATSSTEPGSVHIIGKSAERGDNEGMIDASIEGEELDISFNISYLIDVLNVIGTERVIFQSNGAENPGVIRLEDREDFVHVIMPMSR